MEESQTISVTLLLFYLSLVAKGKDARTIDQLENSSQIIIDRQVNRTIAVRIIVHLICIFIIVLFWGANKQKKHQTRWKMVMSMIALTQIINQLLTTHC
jgi:hypothetical protein